MPALRVQIPQVYNQQLLDHPIRTNCISGGFFGFLGDLICQKGVEGTEDVDWRRNRAFITFCVWYQGGVDTIIYRWYDTVFRVGSSLPLLGKHITTPLRAGLAASCFDNFIHVPFAYTPAYFGTIGVMQGRSADDIHHSLTDSWALTCASCAVIWVPLQLFNFTVVPAQFRVLTVNVGCLLWNVVLDFISNAPATEEKGGEGRLGSVDEDGRDELRELGRRGAASRSPSKVAAVPVAQPSSTSSRP